MMDHGFYGRCYTAIAADEHIFQRRNTIAVPQLLGQMQDISVRQHAPIPAVSGPPMPATLRAFLWRRPPGHVPAAAEPSSFRRENGTEALGASIEWNRMVVLSMARRIETNAEQVMQWFASDVIHELGGKTARQLVEEGNTARLLDMLAAIRSGRRDV